MILGGGLQFEQLQFFVAWFQGQTYKRMFHTNYLHFMTSLMTT